MYKVIHEFLDLQDNSYHYKVGDVYPKEGEAVAERVKELSGKNNKIGVPLIEEIKEEKPKKKAAPKKRTTRKTQ